MNRFVQKTGKFDRTMTPRKLKHNYYHKHFCLGDYGIYLRLQMAKASTATIKFLCNKNQIFYDRVIFTSIQIMQNHLGKTDTKLICLMYSSVL